ncbi:flavin reductase family protein [Micromonospora sp. NPDC007271]|uniref:flavin reductase family protein n=1 Tax=Micromonospora sp. NPDC007271 TaxID=3154587 RepID=UPI0033F2E345
MTETELVDIGSDAFRAIMGSLASGISVITTREDTGRPVGMTSSSLCSVSKQPPLLLFCVRPPSSTLDAIRVGGNFAVNLLDVEGRELSELFASRNDDKFAKVSWRPSERAGMPLLEHTLAYAECAVHNLVEAGDHVIVLGRIVGGGAMADRFPLGYWRGRYVRVFRFANHRGEELNGQSVTSNGRAPRQE